MQEKRKKKPENMNIVEKSEWMEKFIYLNENNNKNINNFNPYNCSFIFIIYLFINRQLIE